MSAQLLCDWSCFWRAVKFRPLFSLPRPPPPAPPLLLQSGIRILRAERQSSGQAAAVTMNESLCLRAWELGSRLKNRVVIGGRRRQTERMSNILAKLNGNNWNSCPPHSAEYLRGLQPNRNRIRNRNWHRNRKWGEWKSFNKSQVAALSAIQRPANVLFICERESRPPRKPLGHTVRVLAELSWALSGRDRPT